MPLNTTLNATAVLGAFVAHACPWQPSLKIVEDGAPIDQFVEWFPGVSLEQARAVLEHAARSALAAAKCKSFSINEHQHRFANS